MASQDAQPISSNSPERAPEIPQAQLSRRRLLKWGTIGLTASALGITASTLNILEGKSWAPVRMAHAAPATLPNIQFDISNYIAPVQTLNSVLFRFGPVYTLFLTATLKRTPTQQDQQVLAQALSAIESLYPFSPEGVFAFVSYGLPYFKRLPSELVAEHMPRLLADETRFALEEAIPGPTDVSHHNSTIKKQTFNVPVAIEKNDLVFTLRSDSLSTLKTISAWLQGSDQLSGKSLVSPPLKNLLQFTSSRLMFVQRGLPRTIAHTSNLPYTQSINPHSPMWMGFADQQVSGSGPAEITTFQGNTSARFTTARQGDYFFDGSIQHLSHVIQDLNQFYARTEPYTERCQYMFRSNPMPSAGYTDQFVDGGGPAFLENIYNGLDDALRNAQARNTYQQQHRMGHLSALQRSSRASDNTPVHIRMDGPGFDALDVPDGSNQPKLQFTIFVPTAHFFATMRKNQAALDLVQKYDIHDDDNGLERFLTATRRQNFLVPARGHRAFPLVELL